MDSSDSYTSMSSLNSNPSSLRFNSKGVPTPALLPKQLPKQNLDPENDREFENLHRSNPNVSSKPISEQTKRLGISSSSISRLDYSQLGVPEMHFGSGSQKPQTNDSPGYDKNNKYSCTTYNSDDTRTQSDMQPPGWGNKYCSAPGRRQKLFEHNNHPVGAYSNNYAPNTYPVNESRTYSNGRLGQRPFSEFSSDYSSNHSVNRNTSNQSLFPSASSENRYNVQNRVGASAGISGQHATGNAGSEKYKSHPVPSQDSPRRSHFRSSQRPRPETQV